MDGILLIDGSTNNWVIQNIAKECASDGFESFLGPDSNNGFISNISIKNRLNAFEIYGSNNLAFNNIAIDNGLGFVSGEGTDTVAIGNKIKGTKTGTYVIFNQFTNYFVGDNEFECNRERGIDQLGQLGTFIDNEFLYHVDTGITLTDTSQGNLVMDNKFVCNIPVSILDNGTNNNFINNLEKACEPCESPDDNCDHCSEEKDKPAKDGR